MKLNKQILEAINRGIQLALDDYEDDGELTSKSNIVKNLDSKKLWDFYNSFVDLGLPSGTKWAKYNLGCDWDKLNEDPKHAKPEDWYGNYYGWGENEPKNNYDWKTYKFGKRDNLTKYNKDGLTELQLEDDAAYQYDKRLKMPTKEQFEELLKYTTNKWVRNYQKIKGLNGRIFKSKINGKEVFIPTSGCYDEKSLKFVGQLCHLWSSSLFLHNSYVAYGLTFYSGRVFIYEYNGRYIGLAIRPVLNQ